eukprot:4310274-Alexandrium_andersonii.AAC.1
MESSDVEGRACSVNLSNSNSCSGSSDREAPGQGSTWSMPIGRYCPAWVTPPTSPDRVSLPM